MTTAAASTRTGRIAMAAVIDVVAVVVFVLIGRRSHDETAALAGIVRTTWPFLAGLTIGWLVARAWQHPMRLWPTGVIVWAATVIGGLALRGVTGGGLAWTFLIVTAVVLALFLLGWRTVAGLLARRGPSGR